MKRIFYNMRGIHTKIEDVTSILEIFQIKPVGKVKTIKGWIKSVRRLKEFLFIDVSDGSCRKYLQVVIAKTDCSKDVRWGTSVNITGKIELNPNGNLELKTNKINVVQACNITKEYPFAVNKTQPFDHYRQYLHFRPQLNYFTSLFRLRHNATQKIHQYFSDNGFIGIHTPIITSNDCEGAGEIFSVLPYSDNFTKSIRTNEKLDKHAFFDSPAFLTVSGQLHLEIMTRSVSKVYTFNPTFRAENSRTRLHLSEFYMVEAEEAFVTNLKILLERIENCLKELVSYLLQNYPEEMEYLIKRNNGKLDDHMKVLENLLSKPFSIMSFAEAKSFLKSKENKSSNCGTNSISSLSKEEELFLVKNNGNIPVFVIDWPKEGKPFYMKQSEENKNLVKGVDLLVPNVGELCGGSLREDDYDILKNKLKEYKRGDSMKWYLDLRKFGNVPTAGFGMGFERFLQFILNAQNIKDTIPFPRWPHNLQL